MIEGNSSKQLHDESWEDILELLRYTAGTYEYEDAVYIDEKDEAERLKAIANTLEAQ